MAWVRSALAAYRLAAIGLSAGIVAIGSALPALAAEALHSQWFEAKGGKVRMIAGRGEGGTVLAGLEVVLEPGWKTYWRSPGDSGVPPEIGWGGSGNVSAASVLFPAPQRFADPAGAIIGYSSRVVLPIVVTPADPARAVDLKIEFAVGVCRDICVPIMEEVNLSVPVDAAAAPAAVTDALAAVPRRLATGVAAGSSAAGTGEAELPRLVTQEIALQGRAPRLVFDVDFGDAATDGDAFAEGPLGSYLPLPKRTGEPAGGIVRFLVDLSEIDDPADLEGKAIVLTMVSEKGATETEIVVP
ncbi:MAG: protein-disulfide reductase DsbD family protein [Hyphomicrobiaceae bacterium]|nr:protein-disulfide reductase DsbD family protein [Hyphomicrobiaceae bacterium]